MPFADGVSVVTVLQEHLGQEAVFEGDIAVITQITGRAFGDAGHVVGMMVAPGQDAGAGGRTQGGGVHIVVTHPACRQAVQVGGGDGAAVAAQVPKAGVVQDDEQDIGRALLSAVGFRPGWLRLVVRSSYDAGKSGSGFVFS
ncbi:MAG: hypothetical protein WBG94_11125 [Anaerolineales bacterium]